MEHEAVIGIEVHAELRTNTKLFCGCSAEFGARPNTHTCPVCLGMPGVLPVMNRQAFEHAVRAALAFNCEVPRITRCDRKNYYYPDLPKNYQISQLYANLGTEGFVELFVNGATKRIGILNVHLEEDAGKLLHPETPGADFSLVDLNRAGVPLLEIVSAPDMRSVEEADAFMRTVRDILLYLGASDCKMEEGSLRFEVSVSLRPRDSEILGTRVEIKNLNSMKAVDKAVDYERRRQEKLLQSGESVKQETRLWDEESETTRAMRSKEEASDYRYFPEPDLVPIMLDEAWVEDVRKSLPELPHYRRRRFVSEYELPEYDASVITRDKEIADYFEEVVSEGGSPKAVSNWIMGDVLRALNEKEISFGGDGGYRVAVPAMNLKALIDMVDSGQLSSSGASSVFNDMVESGVSPIKIVEEKGLIQISGEEELEVVARKAIENNPKPVEDFRKGKKGAVGFLVGQVMKETGGRANPKVVSSILVRLLSGE
jgi:aspartyl-tRNA(Asn)/glutamyl-tRNA(Gln) amidotransferase subunit B